MSFSELAKKAFLIPISFDVRENRRKFLEKKPDRPPIPYSEFSVYEIINRAAFGIQTGDVVQTSHLSFCVITKIKSDGTFVVHSTYWDSMRQTWCALGKEIKLKDVTALLGYNFDEHKAKQHIVIEPAEG